MEIFNLLVPEERTDKNSGEVKTFYHRVGTAFKHGKGEGFNLVIPKGVSISGKVLMFPRKAKGEQAETPDNTAVEQFNEQ